MTKPEKFYLGQFVQFTSNPENKGIVLAPIMGRASTTSVTIRFTARVKQYMKGYMGHREDVYRSAEIDYKLSHPTKVKKV